MSHHHHGGRSLAHYGRIAAIREINRSGSPRAHPDLMFIPILGPDGKPTGSGHYMSRQRYLQQTRREEKAARLKRQRELPPLHGFLEFDLAGFLLLVAYVGGIIWLAAHLSPA